VVLRLAANSRTVELGDETAVRNPKINTASGAAVRRK
jgi:hypothetical protein